MIAMVEAGGPMWRALKKHLVLRIHELRNQLEDDLNDVATAQMRGRIKEIRKLIEAVEPRETSPVDDTASKAPLY